MRLQRSNNNDSKLRKNLTSIIITNIIILIFIDKIFKKITYSYLYKKIFYQQRKF